MSHTLRQMTKAGLAYLLTKLDTQDRLTGLSSRNAFELSVERHVNMPGASGFAILLLHVDRFANVNDMLGHSSGDRLIVTIADRLRQVKEEGWTLARWNSNEFALIIPKAISVTDIQEKVTLCQEIIHQPYTAETPDPVRLTASIGAAFFPEHGTSAVQLLTSASIAMHQAAKDNGDSCHVFDAALSAATLEQLVMEHHLETAVSRNELVVHYQPVISLKTGRIVAVEALVRWQHPKLGLLMPDKFIPIAEATGTINQLGMWVLREATRQNKEWRDAGLDEVRMNVNLSPRQLHAHDLVSRVKEALVETNLPPESLELEITETAIAKDIVQAAAMCKELTALGIRLSIDDFGTGYSALQHLSRFDIDTVKLDRSFVSDLVYSRTHPVPSAIIALSHKLACGVVAEGVETPEQMHWLQKEGCEEAQGFLFSRPVPAEKMTVLLGEKYLNVAV